MSQEKLLHYIHFNRHYNTLLIQRNTKLINQLREENTPLIQDNLKQIDQLRRNLEHVLPGKLDGYKSDFIKKSDRSKLISSICVFSCHVGAQAMWKPNRLLRQNVCGIPGGIFSQWWVSKRWQNDKSLFFPGEVWIGLDKLHQLTFERSYSLRITMTDHDGKKYRAVYEQFEVITKP